MAIARLDSNQKVVLNSDSQMDYVNKADEKKLMAAKTAAINVLTNVVEAKSMGIDKLNVSFKQSLNGEEPKWQSYFANLQKNGNLSLKPIGSEVKDGSDLIYFNKVEKDGKSFYMLNEQSESGKNFANSLTTNTWQDKDGLEHTNLAARVNITDENLKQALIEKGEGAYAVISKDGVNVTTKKEQEATKEATQNKEQPSKENER